MKSNKYLLSTLVLLPIALFSQNVETQKSDKITHPKNLISLKMGADDPWVGISYERLLTKNIGTEVQIGIIGASLGAKLYIPAIKSGRLNFSLGVLTGWGFLGGIKTYFPVGLNLLTKNNFRFSLDAGPRIWHDDNEENFLGASLKIGKGF